MGMFFEVLNAINNPDQQANVEQLKAVTDTVQKVAAENNLDPSTSLNVVSALGQALRPALQQQAQAVGGVDQLGSMISSLTGGGDNPLAGILGQLAGGSAAMAGLQKMIPEQMQQQIIQAVAQKTGLNAGMIQGMLPTLLPTVMGMFQMGANKQGGNPLLNAFLDGDNDGDVDLGDMMKFAGRFLGTGK